MGLTDRIKSYTRWRWKILKITMLSLFYNEHISSDYIFDTLMQPAFWFVDQFTAVLGPVFVCLVIFLTVVQQLLRLPVSHFLSVHRSTDSLLDRASLLLRIQKYLSSLE